MLGFVFYPRTTKRVSWRKLDRFMDCEELAHYLLTLGIRGTPGSATDCALALATGDGVYEKKREQHRWFGRVVMIRRLTPTQRAFVHRYDSGRYPYLELKGRR